MSDLDVDVPAVGHEAEPPQVGVRRGAAETVVFRAVGLPLSFAISVITSRYLEPTGRGAYVLGLLTVTIAATLLGNISAGVTHEIGAQPDRQRTIVSQATILAIVLGVVGTAVLLPLDLTLADQDYRPVALATLALPAMLVTQAASGGMFALGRLRSWNILQLALPAATLAALFVFVIGLGKAVTGAVTSWTLAQIIVGVGALYFTRDLWWPLAGGATRFEFVRPILGLGLRIGLVNVLSLVNYRIELVLLESYRGLHPVGLYSLAVSLGELLWLLSSSLGTATIARAVSGGDREAAEVIARAIRHALILTALAGAALVGVGEAAIPFVFGHAYAPSREALFVLVPGIVAFAPSNVIAVYFSMRLGRARYAFVLAGLSTVVTGLVAVLLIPSYGIVGAAIASTAGYTVSSTAAIAWFLRVARLPAGVLLPRRSDLAAYAALARPVLRR